MQMQTLVSPSLRATLGEAKDWLRQRVDEGERCPCCDQFAKVYRRSIHATMARTLVVAYREHGLDWFHLSTLTKTSGRGGEESKLRYWGLLEEELERRADGGRSGWWRVTPIGRQFVTGQIQLPKYVRIYDGRPLGFESSIMIDIRSALGKKFHYDELMMGSDEQA
jgi:hypothetical protein